MSYLHCHACSWSQDDFWHEGYNPVTCFQNDLDDLLKKDLDEVIEMDSQWLAYRCLKQEEFTRRRMIIFRLDQIKSRINNMVYRTLEEFKEKNPDRICPSCGSIDQLDID